MCLLHGMTNQELKEKVKDFEELWENKTKYVQVYDFMYAIKNNLLKYSSDWVYKD